MNIAQAHDVIHFCVCTHEDMWNASGGGNDASRDFADRTGLSTFVDPDDEAAFIEAAEKVALFLMET